MSDNTIFQGVVPPPIGQPIQSVPPVQPVSSPPVSSVSPVQPMQNMVPQPIQPIPSLQPVMSTSSVPPVSPLTPPVVPPASGGSFVSKLPLKGILKAVIGLVILILLGVVTFTFIIPTFFAAKDEKVTLTYWGLWEDPKIMQGLINDFQKENPNITIKYEQQDVKQYKERLETRIKNGNGPDMFRFHNSWVPEISDIVAPLPESVITPDEFKKVYYPVMQNDLTKNGALYGIPLQIDTLALFTNTEMFEAASLQPPTNWEDFGKDARILTVKDEEGKIKTAGAALGTYDNITHAPDILSLLFVQNGANIYDLASTAQASSDTLSYYTEYASGGSNVWDDTLDPSLLAFSKGNLAMYIG
ncbi:MAG: extracellular solute-binding protein, partial [Candidatus Levybacteria bacterium]|nr:extracellular solute-binding protein [Candidatus Levybacteria bacterium]